MRNLIKIVFCTVIGLAAGCKTGSDCEQLYSELQSKVSSGNFQDAAGLAARLKEKCNGSEQLTGKCDSLMDMTERIRLDFSLTEADFNSAVEKYSLNLTDSARRIYEKKNWIEWKMIDNKKMYFNRAPSNLNLLKRFHEEKELYEARLAADRGMTERLRHSEQVLNESSGNGEPVLPVNMKITYTITIPSGVIPDGESVRCWMPLPKENHPRQGNFKLISASSAKYIISPDTAVHKSLYMEGKMSGGEPLTFSISYSYTSAAVYFDPAGMKIKPYDRENDLYKRYTAEQLPNICFTENIKQLAGQITLPGDDPLTIVRKTYMWFKENIPWTGALEYSIIPNIPEYVYNNRRGDCGMQTFMFMSLLRYRGIPVRWQSGWKVPPDYKNLHDWCEVYFEGPGWVPVDISYDLQASENDRVREFYISGIDAFRLIVNDGVSGPLFPGKNFIRSEPYDFQRGEVEWKGGNLYFDKWDYSMEIEYLKE